MARQSTTPVQFNRSTRVDTSVLMSSARAGVVVPVGYAPLLAGDSASGRVGVDIQLKEMPKPLLNGVHANFQAWFVPKSAFPQFPGRDELMHAMTGEAIKSLGAADRTPPPYFNVLSGASRQTYMASQFIKTLGLHRISGTGSDTHPNSDLIDAFNLVYNFRLAAHSSRLERRPYAVENIEVASTLPPAFWPSSRLSRVVPDYERALIVGSLDLDVISGRLPIANLYRHDNNVVTGGSIAVFGSPVRDNDGNPISHAPNRKGAILYGADMAAGGSNAITRQIFAEMQGQSVGISLADIDKARTTQAFAKLRTAYAGNDSTGFDNDDTIVALLMQGIPVPPDQFKRPWLLDSKRVPVGFAERFATDAANLDQSVTLGRASAQLSLNVPAQDVGGVIIFTVEVLPERIDERMMDEWMYMKSFNDLPNALRDIQRVEPVDLVLNRRVDAKHTQPGGLYGYEPMNDKWNRDFTRLGGDFYMDTPGGGWTENRSNIWQTEIINPVYNETHFLAPQPFPHDVFADQNADAFEVVCRHQLTIVGLTQIGDVLAENNDDYDAVVEAGE